MISFGALLAGVCYGIVLGEAGIHIFNEPFKWLALFGLMWFGGYANATWGA